MKMLKPIASELPYIMTKKLEVIMDQTVITIILVALAAKAKAQANENLTSQKQAEQSEGKVRVTNKQQHHGNSYYSLSL